MPTNSRAETAHTQVPGRHRKARLTTPWALADLVQVASDKAEGEPFAILIVQPAEDGATSGTHVVNVLERTLRSSDLFANIGINRYAILLSGAGRYDAGRVAHRLRSALPNVELGVAAFPQDGLSFGELVSSALAALRPAQGVRPGRQVHPAQNALSGGNDGLETRSVVSSFDEDRSAA